MRDRDTRLRQRFFIDRRIQLSEYIFYKLAKQAIIAIKNVKMVVERTVDDEAGVETTGTGFVAVHLKAKNQLDFDHSPLHQ